MSLLSSLSGQISQVRDGGLKIVFRKLRTLITYLFNCVFGGAIVLVASLARPFITIRFGSLFTSRIGHLAFNMDNYLASRRARNSREWGVFKTDRHISNLTIFEHWRRQEHLLISNVAALPFFFLEKFFPDSPMLISYKKELSYETAYDSLCSTSPSFFRFTAVEEQQGKKLLSDFGINGPFVCFHNRDSAYLSFFGDDGNLHDFRDFEFDDYRLAIESIVRLNIYALRLGEIVAKKSALDLPLFQELTGSKRRDFFEIYLMSKCLFFVGGNTGFSNVARIMRKPQLIVNFLPFRIRELTIYSENSLFIPKKLYKVKEGRYLRYREMNALPYDIHYKGDFFADHGIRIENNTPEEIEDAVLEMHSRTEGSWVDSEAQQQLQNQFWNSLGDEPGLNLLHRALKSTISSTFLERNRSLL
ncbi:TIGR04372 family glycosyltransferase [Chlorobium ferrooxidans]|uniref:TIGR04372 family glycosyltransferase n=1 Tax=Chlorobium ferrooxidans DSM 13031 TaxID=377431 RepID=Q0YTW8_9CHLB|nr:TIGR04372 family glycosyltransferase [Chlorobium ferrooxidans]EAT59784.1 hypothetical protein CferDRAFT_1791 [Chlorobium ferrooxidans DSM 13031]